jgi:hypothetical protein
MTYGGPLTAVIRTLSGHLPRAEFDPTRTSAQSRPAGSYRLCGGRLRSYDVTRAATRNRQLADSLKAATMSEVRHQLLITLVHGTWGRGFFPRRQRQNRHPLWFEEGSPFLARLSTELRDIPHKIRPFLWSGANSIFVRDKTAHALAEHLSAEHSEHPQATQIVVAHSHGGNIALRALHHLRQDDASHLCGSESANPLVVTLATPFIEVYQADFGRRPFYVRMALIILILVQISSSLVGELVGAPSAGFEWILFGLLVLIQEQQLGLTNEIVFRNEMVVSILCLALSALMGWWWVVRRAPARQKQLEALKNVTRLGEIVSAQRLLVIRAIDDEASLTLALGAIVNYVTARSITYLLLLYLVIMIVPFVALLIVSVVDLTEWLVIGPVGLFYGCSAFAIVLLGVLMVSRTVHGRELARSPMECQVNTQSTPDGVGLSRIVTLVRRTFKKSLRHGIYDHEDCAKTISDWIHSQLCAMPVRQEAGLTQGKKGE